MGVAHRYGAFFLESSDDFAIALLIKLVNMRVNCPDPVFFKQGKKLRGMVFGMAVTAL